MVTSSIDPSRTVTLASAALPDDVAGFFFGVLGLVAGAGSAVLDSPGIAAKVPCAGNGIGGLLALFQFYPDHQYQDQEPGTAREMERKQESAI